MHARVTELSGVSPSAIDRDMRYFEDEILPSVEAIPGCCGGLVLVDRERGTAMAITLWADDDSLAASREVADQLRDTTFQRMNLTKAAIVREYEVGVAQLTEAISPAGR